MKYSWEDPAISDRFPASAGWKDGSHCIGFADIYDATGKQIGPLVVAFDSETGEIWEKIGDDDGHGQTLLRHSTHPAPLKWIPLRGRDGVQARVVDVSPTEHFTDVPVIYDDKETEIRSMVARLWPDITLTKAQVDLMATMMEKYSHGDMLFVKPVNIGMTVDKLKQVLEYYDTFLDKDRCVDPIKHNQPTHWIEKYQHLRWMCRQCIDIFIPAGEIDKAMRWLGFIQGVLFERGDFTINQMRDHSRG